MSNQNPIDVDKINRNIFGTPNLQDTTALSHSETHTTINTSDYETPAESLNDSSDYEPSVHTGAEQSYRDEVSAYTNHNDETVDVSTLKSDSDKNNNHNNDNNLERTNSQISNPENYFSEDELKRVHTQNDLFEADLERTLSRKSAASHKKHTTSDSNDVDDEGILLSHMEWDGPNDKENPQNFSSTKKWFITMTAATICLVVTFGSSLYVSGVYDIMAEMGASQELVLAGLTLYLVGLALGPAVAAPLSEMFGRKIVYITSLPISMLFIMGVGLAKNIETILVLRFFSGFMASPAMAVAGGTISDLWSPDMVGLAMSAFCMAPFLGPVAGPVIGSFVAEHKGWKWCLWVNLMAAGAILPFVFLADETYKVTIMQKRAKKRGIKIKQVVKRSEFIKVLFMITLIRPLKMLVVEPIVIAWSIYVAFVFAVLFGFFEAYPVIFQGTYGMAEGISGLPFLGIGVGLCIGTVVFVLLDRLYFFKKNEDGSMGRKGKNGEPFKHTPESRLLVCKIGAVGFPVSLFWLGWTAKASIHWMAPLAAGVPFGFSLILIFFGVMIYQTMSYPPLSVASALAANNLARYVLASVFPLFTVQMYERLGNGWASSVFGFIALALVPVPWIFEKWGPQMRSRSRFGFEAMKREMEGKANSTSSSEDESEKSNLVADDTSSKQDV